MSWSGLITSGFITGNDLQDAVNTSVFSLKPGASIPANNTFLTKAQIEALVNVTVTPWSANDLAPKASVASAGTALLPFSYYISDNKWLATLGDDFCSESEYLYSASHPDTLFLGESIYWDAAGTIPASNGYYSTYSPYYASAITFGITSGVITSVDVGYATKLIRRTYGRDVTPEWPYKYDYKEIPYIDNPDNNPGYMQAFTIDELGGWAVGSKVYQEIDGCYQPFYPGTYAYFRIYDPSNDEEHIIITNLEGVIIAVDYIVGIWESQLVWYEVSDPYDYAPPSDPWDVREYRDYLYQIRARISHALSAQIIFTTYIDQYFDNYSHNFLDDVPSTIPAGQTSVLTNDSNTLPTDVYDNPDEPFVSVNTASFTYLGWELIQFET